jgi:hypothetical protein
MATEFGTSPSLPGLRTAASVRDYERRRPGETELHGVVREQLEGFPARARERDHSVPRFVEQTLRTHLACDPSAELRRKRHTQGLNCDLTESLLIGPRKNPA